MYPGAIAKETPDKPAYVMAASGDIVTYGQLDEASNRGAQLLRSLGLLPGDGIAICMENHPRFLEICWAAQRSGLVYTPISSRLTAVARLAERGDPLHRPSVYGHIEQHRSRRQVPIPDVVMQGLVVPLQLARLEIDRHHGVGEEVHASSGRAVVVRRGVGRIEVDDAHGERRDGPARPGQNRRPPDNAGAGGQARQAPEGSR